MLLSVPISEVVRTTKDRVNLLRERGIKTLEDLLFWLPWRYSDETEFSQVIDLVNGEAQTVRGTLTGLFKRRTRTGKLMIRAFLEDETGRVELLWFNQNYLLRQLSDGMEMIVTGKAKVERSKVTMMSPKYEIPGKAELVHTGRLVPVYHSIGKLSAKWFRDKVFPILYLTDQIKDYLPSYIREEESLMGLSEAIKTLHFPEKEGDLPVARRRLAFDELFCLQLGAKQRKRYWQEEASKSPRNIILDQKCVQEFIGKLPFSLTEAQSRVLDEIFVDIEKPYPMSRLVEGDVGSGKTVVAAAALWAVINQGYQGLLMAPTEILARQHYQSLFDYLKNYGVNIAFLAGSVSKSKKEEVYTQLRQGTVDLVIGTHALLQDKVEFRKLGLAIIDEQHRFGVKQREILKTFGSPHLLSLTATPIPRSLALTIYGDQEVSIIDELPPGRQEILTRVVPESKRDDAYRWIEAQVNSGRQVFIVCPLIEDSEEMQVRSVVTEYERLKSDVFSDLTLGLLHGRMRQFDKDEIMDRFARNELQVLVSTTVIEVGIDVPNATIMLIEGAERFGLAQLHQLRGRVGRGEHQSYCFLFPDSNSPESKQRMKAMTTYSDGFKLAEIDLSMRGPGEVYGVKQSGIPDLKIASLGDKDLTMRVAHHAEQIIAEDYKLVSYPLLNEKLNKLDRDFGIDY